MFDAEGVRIDPSPPPRGTREAADDLADSRTASPSLHQSPGGVSGNIYRPNFDGHAIANTVGLQGQQAFSAVPESVVVSGTQPSLCVSVLSSDDVSQASASAVFSAKTNEGYRQTGSPPEHKTTGQIQTCQGGPGAGH